MNNNPDFEIVELPVLNYEAFALELPEVYTGRSDVRLDISHWENQDDPQNTCIEVWASVTGSSSRCLVYKTQVPTEMLQDDINQYIATTINQEEKFEQALWHFLDHLGEATAAKVNQG